MFKRLTKKAVRFNHVLFFIAAGAALARSDVLACWIAGVGVMVAIFEGLPRDSE